MRLILLMCIAFPALGDEVDIDVVALFKDAALFEINGERQLLKEGERSEEGILLLSADSREAIIELGGREVRLNLSSKIGAQFQKPESRSVSVSLNKNGQFRTTGSINGRPATFLIDTGANIVAMKLSDARSLGIDFTSGKLGNAVTAGGVVASWEVMLDTVQIGDISVSNVRAAVLEGGYPEHILLGMTFLTSVEIKKAQGILTLTSKF